MRDATVDPLYRLFINKHSRDRTNTQSIIQHLCRLSTRLVYLCTLCTVRMINGIFERPFDLTGMPTSQPVRYIFAHTCLFGLCPAGWLSRETSARSWIYLFVVGGRLCGGIDGFPFYSCVYCGSSDLRVAWHMVCGKYTLHGCDRKQKAEEFVRSFSCLCTDCLRDHWTLSLCIPLSVVAQSSRLCPMPSLYSPCFNKVLLHRQTHHNTFSTTDQAFSLPLESTPRPCPTDFPDSPAPNRPIDPSSSPPPATSASVYPRLHDAAV